MTSEEHVDRFWLLNSRPCVFALKWLSGEFPILCPIRDDLETLRIHSWSSQHVTCVMTRNYSQPIPHHASPNSIVVWEIKFHGEKDHGPMAIALYCYVIYIICSDSSTIRGVDGIIFVRSQFLPSVDSNSAVTLFGSYDGYNVLVWGGLQLSNRHQELPRILLLMARPQRLALAGPESGDLLTGGVDFAPSSASRTCLALSIWQQSTAISTYFLSSSELLFFFFSGRPWAFHQSCRKSRCGLGSSCARCGGHRA